MGVAVLFESKPSMHKTNSLALASSRKKSNNSNSKAILKKTNKAKTSQGSLSKIYETDQNNNDNDSSESSSSYMENNDMERLINANETVFTALVLVAVYVFYFCIFHSLANLPLGDKLLYGIHQRFWMQPNILLFCFAGVGFNYCVYAISYVFYLISNCCFKSQRKGRKCDGDSKTVRDITRSVSVDE